MVFQRDIFRLIFKWNAILEALDLISKKMKNFFTKNTTQMQRTPTKPKIESEVEWEWRIEVNNRRMKAF